MRPPIWYDWEYHAGGGFEDHSSYYVGFWRGATDDGRPVSVPCIYADSDLLNKSPVEIATMKAHIKENGLNSYYDIGREMYYDNVLTSGD